MQIDAIAFKPHAYSFDYQAVSLLHSSNYGVTPDKSMVDLTETACMALLFIGVT